MNRRTFLKLTGMGSISLAVACSPPEKHLYTLVHAPEDMVTGKAQWYASTCRECPAGCGVLAKNREARIVKVEGNPQHPINRGKLCIRGQAALQAVYNPDRLKVPRIKENGAWSPISYSAAIRLIKDKTTQAAAAGTNRVRMASEMIGDSQLELFRTALKSWKSDGPLIFEPFGYEALKTANEHVFGVDGLISYRIEQAKVLVSFGADFLETWLSPVEYARKFKQMHSLGESPKGFFTHISPYLSLTGANADLWLACRPGSEAVIAFGLIKQALDIGKGKQLPPAVRKALLEVTAGYTQEHILELSGIPLDPYEKLIIRLMETDKPLVLGMGTGASDTRALQTNLAANLLNLILDPQLALLDFEQRHRVEIAARHSEVLEFFQQLNDGSADLLLLNKVNPVFSLPQAAFVRNALRRKDLFVVSFSDFLDETAELADLVVPVGMPLETWDEYGGKSGMRSTLQPTMGSLTQAPHLGDVFLEICDLKDKPAEDYQSYLHDRLAELYRFKTQLDWLHALERGGLFETTPEAGAYSPKLKPDQFVPLLKEEPAQVSDQPLFVAAPSIRFFDGRGANRPWLCEVPETLTRVSWESPVLMHPSTAENHGLQTQEVVELKTRWGKLEAAVYVTEIVRPGMLVMSIGQGHTAYGRYAAGVGANPLLLMAPDAQAATGGMQFSASSVSLRKTDWILRLSEADASRTQHDRTYLLSIGLEELRRAAPRPESEPADLGILNFPFTLPLKEGYSPERDFYPPIQYPQYRWSMVVDLDRCIGCAACAGACYAENNVGIVGRKHVVERRRMAWLNIIRYHDSNDMAKVKFLPMLCQHCSNAPCESVCPVYAPHHSKEGINNQIYNRCIGTRFCSQNCPYKVRRFNWFDWPWPEPINLQANPDVTVRSKGVMEKCSFCIQRIKEVRTIAKNEKRRIRDGEITPACVQTCPTDALMFGDIMDPNGRVRKLIEKNPRAYQMMGYLNTKPAVIYLKKVTQEV